MRLGTLIAVLWLLAGVVAAGQRHYYGGRVTGCSHVETIAETIAIGPLNYMGVNPKTACHLPQPSK